MSALHISGVLDAGYKDESASTVLSQKAHGSSVSLADSGFATDAQ